ncbi:transposable element tc3 transposase-like protein [Holotrichia oblita]|uniref:Transposable element tc3 transposase-like protein n=1 Tax=Holotrichia oblita TaxID=644536 RepID=A0ACB9TE76_HOLOL|nr:transposable element tc3 transposase-like protein [Holotrichia oblita]
MQECLREIDEEDVQYDDEGEIGEIDELEIQELPEPMNMEGDIAKDWMQFKDDCELYTVATGCTEKKTKEIQAVTLLRCCGKETREILSNLEILPEVLKFRERESASVGDLLNTCKFIFIMAVHYTNEEMTDMCLVYGYCQGNSSQFCQVYSERFPNRRTSNHKTFAAVERRLRETGRLVPVSVNYGRACTVRTPEVEEDILDRIEENPKLSSRRLGLEVGVSKDTVNRVTRTQLLQPFHVQRVHDLLPHDFEARLVRDEGKAERNLEKAIVDRTSLTTAADKN